MSDGAKPLTISRTSSDEYFVDDDPDFLEALLRAKLSGDVPECSEGSSLKLEEKVEETKQVAGIYESLKRKRSVSPDPNMPASQSQDSSRINGTDLDVYGASRFGHFGEYMRRKRAKLQIQNTHLQRTDEDSKKSAIFRGLAIYINGWTDPSLQVLRQLIVQHGGVFHAYLDKKSLVTHIITCSLTPAKSQEFKHMKVVKPEWLVESARLGTLLPWREFKFQQSHKIDHCQGLEIPQKTVNMLPSPSRASRQPALAEVSMSSTIEIDDSLEQDLQFPPAQPELPSLPNVPNSPIPTTKPRYTTQRSVDSNSNSNRNLSSTIHPPHGLNDESASPPISGPSKTAELVLPSFSQIDMNVFNVLPEDVRQELEAEYKRRSVSPLPPMFSMPAVKPASKITVKGTKTKSIPRKPTSSRSVTKSPTKLQASSTQATRSSVHVSEAELRKLNIEPEIFIELPVDVQREQLALARQAKFAGVQPIKLVQRIVIKPLKPRPSAAVYRHPPPQAKYPPLPFIKQWDKDMKEKLHFTEVEDVQQVIEAWVEAFNGCSPNDGDVKNLAKFLVRSVDGSKSTDVGLENAVRVMKWWMVLLRKHWGQWENVDGRNEDCSSTGNVTSEVVGKAWWKAFREVKGQMDLTACKKFGGRISLK